MLYTEGWINPTGFCWSVCIGECRHLGYDQTHHWYGVVWLYIHTLYFVNPETKKWKAHPGNLPLNGICLCLSCLSCLLTSFDYVFTCNSGSSYSYLIPYAPVSLSNLTVFIVIHSLCLLSWMISQEKASNMKQLGISQEQPWSAGKQLEAAGSWDQSGAIGKQSASVRSIHEVGKQLGKNASGKQPGAARHQPCKYDHDSIAGWLGMAWDGWW